MEQLIHDLKLQTTKSTHQEDEKGININFNGSKQLRRLYKVAAVLVVLNLIAIACKYYTDHPNAWGIIPQFELDNERNVPTYFSSFILLLSSVLLFALAALKGRQKAKHVWQWRLLAGIFLYMSMDESAGIHEMLIYPLRENFELTGIFYFSWVIVGGLLVLGLGLYYLPFLIALEPKLRTGLFGAGFIYVSGALGVELLGGYYSDTYGEENFTYGLITTVEETLEIAGVLLMLTVLYNYLKQEAAYLRLNLRSTRATEYAIAPDPQLTVVQTMDRLN